MAYLSVRRSSSIKASINYILKDEQTGHGLLIEENNCNQFNFEKLVCLDEEKYRKKERNIDSLYKNEEESYLDSLRAGRGIQVLKNNPDVYAYTGYVTFSSEDDISLSDARDIASESLKKTLGKDARFIVAAHTQGRNIHAHFVCENGRSQGIQPRDFLFKNTLKEKVNEVCKEKGLSSIYESMMYNRNRPKMTAVERMERKKRNPKEKFYTLNDRVSNSLKRNVFSCQFSNVSEVKKSLEKEGYKIEGDKIYPQYRNTPILLSNTRFKSWKKIKEILDELNKINEKKLKEIFKMQEKDNNFRNNHKDYFQDAILQISAKDMYVNKDNIELENIVTLEDEVEFIKSANEKELEFRLAISDDEDVEREMEKEVRDYNDDLEQGKELVDTMRRIAQKDRLVNDAVFKIVLNKNTSVEEKREVAKKLKEDMDKIKNGTYEEMEEDFSFEPEYDEKENNEYEYEPDFYDEDYEELKKESLNQDSFRNNQNIHREL